VTPAAPPTFFRVPSLSERAAVNGTPSAPSTRPASPTSSSQQLGQLGGIAPIRVPPTAGAAGDGQPPVASSGLARSRSVGNYRPKYVNVTPNEIVEAKREAERRDREQQRGGV